MPLNKSTLKRRLTAGMEWFKVWRTIEGEADAPSTLTELEVLIRGAFEPGRQDRLGKTARPRRDHGRR